LYWTAIEAVEADTGGRRPSWTQRLSMFFENRERGSKLPWDLRISKKALTGLEAAAEAAPEVVAEAGVEAKAGALGALSPAKRDRAWDLLISALEKRR
jgi:hypothetical protein